MRGRARGAGPASGIGRRARAIAAAALLALVPAAASAACEVAQAPATRWSIERVDGRDWLRDPCGARELAIGVDVVDAGASGDGLGRPHYDWRRFAASPDAWADATRRRLLDWGFNSAGAWSLPPQRLGLPTTINLELGRLARFHWFDPFAPDAAARVYAAARRLTRPWRGTPLRIGYFSDNEVGWWGGALFLFFSRKPAANYTKQRWVAMLRTLYRDDFGRFAADFVPPAGVHSWPALLAAEAPTHLRPGGQGSRAVARWTGEVAERYYAVAAAALKKADPGALFLGDRLPIYYDPAALRAEARHVDAISVNYNVDSPEGWIAPYFFDGIARLSGGKPVFISEWFYAARENRSGNTDNGHLMTVDTQAERAAGAAAAARGFAALPALVGLDWFQYYDYPRGGRADREDYDFGLVDIDDRPYDELVAALGGANRELPRLHALARPPARQQLAGFAVPYARIDAAARSLIGWPKPAALLPPFRAAGGAVPFGEAYLAWSEAGLALAFIGQDYYDPQLLAYDGAFPLSEAFQIAIGADAGAGARRFTLAILPPPRGAKKASMRAVLCQGAPPRGGAPDCAAVPGATALYLGADQPRIVAAAVLPWRALGAGGPPADGAIRLDLAARTWYRARVMALVGTRALAAPAAWPRLRLAPAQASGAAQ